MFKKFFPTVIFALLFLLAGLFAPARMAVQAAPKAEATPALSTIWSAQALTTSTRSTAINLEGYSQADLQVTIVQGSTVNTATVTFDRSNNGYNWATGNTLLNASAISTTAVVSNSIIGRYGSIYITLSNSQPVTVTVLAWNRP